MREPASGWWPRVRVRPDHVAGAARPDPRADQALARLRQRPQAARADLEPKEAVAAAYGHALDVHVPAPLGVALGKANIVPELWPSLATEGTSMRHRNPLMVSNWSSGGTECQQQVCYSTMSKAFVQTAWSGYPPHEVSVWRPRATWVR